MMRKFVSMIFLLGLVSLAAAAQDFPKAEVFGGYQYTRFDGGVNANGWNGAATANFKSWLGVTGDFSGAYDTVSGVSLRNYTYTFGPTISMRAAGNFTPFAHALFGGFHSSASSGGVSVSDSGFASFLGGGVDFKLSQRLALRAAQVDWLLVHANGTTDKNNVRISTGLVFKF